MRILCEIFFVFAVIAYCDSARKSAKRQREAEAKVEAEEEDEDMRWLNEACHQYNFCLYEADRMLAFCNSMDNKSSAEEEEEHDEIQDCAHPTLVLKKELKVKRDNRKTVLRTCFETGVLEGSKSNFRDLGIGSRHQSTCISRIAEFEQRSHLKDKQKKGGKKDEEEPLPQTKHQCKAAAKRFRERCDRLESCCARAKLCKKDMAKTKLAKEIKNIVDEIKSVRKTCREKTSRVAARADEG